jgi:BlaI family transcriptional regulator, penicillinase repressor
MKVSWLAPREREVADIVYARGEASAADVCRALSDPITNAAVRSMLTRLHAKGVLRRRKEGNRYFYAPAASDRAAREAALRKVSRDYFGGSLAETAAAVMDMARRVERARIGTG